MIASADAALSIDVEDLLSSVLAATAQPIWVVGSTGQVLYANPMAVQVLGYHDASDVVGHNSHALVHSTRPDGSPFPVAECPMLRLLHEGTVASGEDWFRRADGSFIQIAWSSAAVMLPSGRGVVHAFEDLTVRRRHEREQRAREIAEVRRSELQAAHRRLMENMHAARVQIVRDLHDGAQQRLVALALQAQILREELATAEPTLVELVDGVLRDAQLAIDELRDLAAGIQPPVLTSLGLVAAIRSQADRCPLAVTVSGNAAGVRMDRLIESHVYFFVAEALTNAAKHSRGSTVDVELIVSDAELQVRIHDDGIGGVEVSNARTGIGSMRDRIRTFEGLVQIDSPVGMGTTITAQIPLDQPPR